MVPPFKALLIVTTAVGLSVLPSNQRSYLRPHHAVAQEVMVRATTAAEMPPITIDAAVDSGASAILKAAWYEPFASLRVGSETFVLAKGSTDNWHWMCGRVFEDVEVYAPRGKNQPEGEHVIVGHFAPSIKEDTMHGLARARDQYAMMSPTSNVYACAFADVKVECEIGDGPLSRVVTKGMDVAKRMQRMAQGHHGIPAAVKDEVDEAGVFVLVGEALGLTVELAELDAALATEKQQREAVERDVAAEKQQREAAEGIIDEKNTALAELANATVDPALRAKLEEILSAGTTSGAE